MPAPASNASSVENSRNASSITSNRVERAPEAIDAKAVGRDRGTSIVSR